jgi:hypothetical protein
LEHHEWGDEGEELKKLLKAGKNWKTILKWGLGLGIPLSVLYWMVKDSGEDLPQDLPDWLRENSTIPELN